MDRSTGSKRPFPVDDETVEAPSRTPRTLSQSIIGGKQNGQREYQHGAIVKVTMKSFVTYDYCTFSPGPNLNMIIGPNGTGKSTIVCAIALGLGWNTSVLGRAKDVSEFVKHGSEKGWIEISLYNAKGPNVVIKRHINKNNNTSVWKINGENKSQKEVMKKVQSFNIQVDNLCQFLPQDRVSEFAQLSPQELLRETQRAVGGDEMVATHEKLIELWNEHKAISLSVKGDNESIEANEKRNAIMEKDVLRLQQHKAALRKIKLLEIWKIYALYGEAKEEYNAIKEQRRIVLADIRQLEAQGAPLEKKKSLAITAEKEKEGQKAETERKYQRRSRELRAKESAIEAEEGKAEELKKDLDRIHAKARKRLEAIDGLKKQIAALEEKIQSAKSDNEIQAEREVITRQMNRIQGDQNEIRDKIENIQSEQKELADQCKKYNIGIHEKTNRLNQLDDIRDRRLMELRKGDRDIYTAVMWLRENANKFQKQVFEPVCLEINVKKSHSEFAGPVENLLMNYLKTIFCQTREDYNFITRELLDRQRLRVDVIAPVARDLDLNNFNSPLAQHQIERFGFDCYALDALEGPPTLLAALCSKAQLHQVPMTRSTNLDFEAISRSRQFKRYLTSTASYVISYSKYTKEAMDTKRTLRPAQILTASVDHELRARLLREIDEARSKQEEAEKDVQRLQKDDSTWRIKYDALETERRRFDLQRKELMENNRKASQNKYSLERLNASLQAKESEMSSEEEEEQIRQQVNASTLKRTRLIFDHHSIAKDVSGLFSQLNIQILARLQAHAELQAITTECKEYDRELDEAKESLNEVDIQYNKIKDKAKDLLARTKQEYGELKTDELDEFQDLAKGWSLDKIENELESERAKTNSTYTPNMSVMEKYDQRQNEINNTRAKVEAKTKRLDKIASDIAHSKAAWYHSLTETIGKISEEFSKAFERIGCAGEVKLSEVADYDKWGIDILVKFRDAEKLQKLTGQRQSGGERSVSTIMYLMTLQALSNVSFRVVDEINQGMDPRNERLVHKQLVEKACTEKTSQYFLITPKLLPNLDYHERMGVLTIFNGEWLDQGAANWGPYIARMREHKAKNHKARRLA
ncbi:Structural maintenance of chromosomes protein 5 [Actinomortierella ambigua]|uniref:Structural maintenance of chromosomes protein 5 n=1 Tax=Actinomortierella ambigua TaxID=1343610 RepID=A0A9P6U3A5_9FUNG|nr:Structural maintenance of chromosomes protein 5 [Actinomortierella ambigua]